MMRAWSGFCLACAVVLFPASLLAGPPVELTECGLRDLKGKFFLSGDLDCSDFGHHIGVNFVGRARLELRGFNIIGSRVQCMTGCKIEGPGSLIGGGVRVARQAKIIGIDIVDCVGPGVRAANNVNRGRAAIRDSVITGCTGDGVDVDTKAVISGSVISNNGRHGVTAGHKVVVSQSTISGNHEDGVSAGQVLCDESRRGRILLKDSAVTGNAQANSEVPGGLGCEGANVDRACADLASCVEPSLRRESSCHLSTNLSTGHSWNVCSLD